MVGERHLLTIGKGNQPVKTFGVNVTIAKPNDMGTLDLTGSCPQ